MTRLNKIKNFSNIKYHQKLYKFLSYGFFNFFLTNLILQFSLLIFSTILATFISQIFNFFCGYYLYGKKVFRIKQLSKIYFIRYFFLSIIIWNLNWILINFIHSFNVSKNLASIMLIPFLALFSYFYQKSLVFN